MKHGFVLIEVIISVLIASFLATGLLTTIFQISRVQQTVITITTVNSRIALLQNQMERDVMGAFVPAQIDMVQTSTRTQEQLKPVEKVFYGTSRGNGGRLDILTFITSNPLEVFYGVKNSKLKPRVARVVYRLLPDERRQNSYVLWRQEGTTDLTFEKYTNDSTGERRSFAMIDGIQNLTISYIAVQQAANKDASSEKRIYKKSAKWESEQKKNVTDTKQSLTKKEPVQLPNYIEVTIALWNSTFDDTRTFYFTIPIMYKASEVTPLPAKTEATEPTVDTPPPAAPEGNV